MTIVEEVWRFTCFNYQIANIPVEIQYMYSKARADEISLLIELLPDAIRSGRQWKIERGLGELTTDCITTLVPKGLADMSITLWVGQEAGIRINNKLRLVPTWTSLPSHAEP